METHGYRPGDWAAICDICGFEFYASELILQYDGLRVCRKDWSPRHPQEYVRGVKDRITVPWTRAEPPEVFLEPNEVTYSAGHDSGFDEGFG